MSWSQGWNRWNALPGVTLDVFHWHGSSNGARVLITAGIHGDEYEGPAAIAALVAELDPAKIRGSITAVPIANPSAFEAGTRLNSDGLNLARCFPGNKNGKETERLAASLFENLATNTDYLIDLHSGGVQYLFLPVAGFYGEAVPTNPSFAGARHFGLPALWKLPETDGVLSCEAAKRGIVAIGNEYLGAGQLSLEGLAAYRDGVRRCLTAWGIYDGPCTTPPLYQQLLIGDWQIATRPGIFQSRFLLGAPVSAGERIAFTSSPTGTIVEEFFAGCNGIFGGFRSKAYIREGDWAVLVQRESDVT